MCDEQHAYVYVLFIVEGDSLSYHVGMAFSTKDRDNDKSDKNCAEVKRGGWWYKDCSKTNPTGDNLLYGKGDKEYGMTWETWRGPKYSLEKIRMLVREYGV